MSADGVRSARAGTETAPVASLTRLRVRAPGNCSPLRRSAAAADDYRVIRQAVGPRVRTRSRQPRRQANRHAAADSPQAMEPPDRRIDGWKASGSPQAACGPSARALEDVGATRAVRRPGRCNSADAAALT